MYVAGVDGGTTKTICLVADTEGHILGASRSGCSNYVGAGEAAEKTAEEVAKAVHEALQQAGLSGDSIAVGVFGLAGADWPEDYEPRVTALRSRGLARRILVKNDSIVALRAGTHKPYGVAICCGTGTNTAIIAPDGREWQYGYWTDYGGSGSVAKDAVRAVLRAADGRGRPTMLTERVLSILDYPTPEAMLRAMVADQFNWRKVHIVCPLVFEIAFAGDEVARSIVIKLGQELALYATAAIHRFGMEALEFDVVLSGGVFKGKGPLLVDTITQAVHAVAPCAHIVRPRFEPAIGGVLLALDALDVTVDDTIYTNLQRTQLSSTFFGTATSTPGARAGE